MNQRDKTQRLIFTAQHCNSQVMLWGNMSGTELVFGYKFTSQPAVTLTIVGTGVINSVTYDQDTHGYYTGVTVSYTCSSLSFFVAGNAIVVVEE